MKPFDDPGLAPLEPFESEHDQAYLADSLFDYPASEHGWAYRVLSEGGVVEPLEPIESLAATSTPLAQLGSADPYALLGRDTLHVGHRMRPCLVWQAPHAGCFRLEGEVSLLRTEATGGLVTTVLADGHELLAQPIDHPQELRFSIDFELAAQRELRVVFSCRQLIDNNHALYYLRIRPVRALHGSPNVRWACSTDPDWARLGHSLAFEPDGVEALEPNVLMNLSRTMYDTHRSFMPQVSERVQALAAREFDPQFGRLGQPRFFSLKLQPAPKPAR